MKLRLHGVIWLPGVIWLIQIIDKIQFYLIFRHIMIDLDEIFLNILKIFLIEFKFMLLYYFYRIIPGHRITPGHLT